MRAAASSRASGRLSSARADLAHRLVKFEVMPDGSCALDEEGRGVRGRKWVNWILVLGREVERHAARDDEPDTRGTCEQVREIRSGIDHVLECVEDEEELPFAQVVSEVITSGEGISDSGQYEFGVGEAGEWHPPDTVRVDVDELRSDLEREACLSRSTWTGDRYEPVAVTKKRGELGHFPLAPDQSRLRRRAKLWRRAFAATGSLRARAERAAHRR